MFHRRRLQAPINTVKHYVQQSNISIASGAAVVFNAVVAVANTALPASTNEVVEGAIVKAIYVEWWFKGTGASDADTQFNFVLFKNPGGSNNMTYTDALNMMAYDNKKNILFVSQGVIGGVGGGQSVPVIRQWIKIPKGKQRFGLNDKFQILTATTGEAMQACGVVVFKEYR